MKKSLLVLFLMFFALDFINAQEIPNAGFESWTGNNPDSWFTINIPGLGEPVTKSTDSHSGSSAARLEMIPFQGTVIPPVLTSLGFPVTQQHGSLQGFYKFAPVSGEEFSIAVFLWKDGGAYGGGAIQITAAAASYTQFVMPITYASAEIPDSAQIYIAISDTGDTQDAGAVGFIDDLSFGGVVGIDEQHDFNISEFKLIQNYPNPFNPSTRIDYSVPTESFVELKIFDMLGNEVASLVNENLTPGSYSITFDGAGLSSGTYVARMKAANFIKSFKMILMK